MQVQGNIAELDSCFCIDAPSAGKVDNHSSKSGAGEWLLGESFLQKTESRRSATRRGFSARRTTHARNGLSSPRTPHTDLLRAVFTIMWSLATAGGTHRRFRIR